MKEGLDHTDGQSAFPTEVRAHYFSCKICGQAIDRRSRAQVFHHQMAEHQPLNADELSELSSPLETTPNAQSPSGGRTPGSESAQRRL